MRYTLRPPARMGKAAIIAIAAAAVSLVLTCGGWPGWGLLAAVVALVSGLAGLVRSASPEIRGGPISLLALLLGALGFVTSLVVLLVQLLRAPPPAGG